MSVGRSVGWSVGQLVDRLVGWLVGWSVGPLLVSGPKGVDDICFHTWRRVKSQGGFPVTDNRVLNRPLGRSLCSFARTAHSTHSLSSALLRYAHFPYSLHWRACSVHGLAPVTGLLTDFAHSLMGQLKFFNRCSCCKHIQWEHTRFLLSLETRPDNAYLLHEKRNSCSLSRYLSWSVHCLMLHILLISTTYLFDLIFLAVCELVQM